MAPTRPAIVRPTLTHTNLIKFISLLIPFLIVFFMLMYSLVNNNIIKGMLFIAGTLIVTIINYILKNLLQSEQVVTASPYCNYLPSPFSVVDSQNSKFYDSPSLSSTIIAYTCGVLVYPMYINNNFNSGLTTLLVALLGINGTVEYQYNCTNISGIILGILTGLIFGILYYLTISLTGNPDLAYYTKIASNNTQCSKPGKQKFRCITYRKGKPVNSRIT